MHGHARKAHDLVKQIRAKVQNFHFFPSRVKMASKIYSHFLIEYVKFSHTISCRLKVGTTATHFTK